ncbi:hypothetical protein V3C99_016527 [Haemonchus contortus]|uniref:ShKT domain-containing protein n=1 Tax=Haemonchus contortus TaxID=6289 RepID=A0A7I4YWB6_HAECO
MQVLFFVLCILVVIVNSAQVCRDDPGYENVCKYGKRFCKRGRQNNVMIVRKHCRKTCGLC